MTNETTRAKLEKDKWDEFVRRAQEYIATGRLESEEIGYKVEVGRKLAEAREAVLAGTDDWADLLKRALNPNDANFINWRNISNFNQWCVGYPDEALKALQAIWTGDASSVAERVRDFCDLLPESVISGAGTRLNLASGLLMGLDVQQYPPFLARLMGQTYERTGYSKPEKPADEAALYEHALDFLDQFIEEAQARGLTLRHRLDAQSLVWAIREGSGDPPESEGQATPRRDEQPEELLPSTDPLVAIQYRGVGQEASVGATRAAEDH